MTVYRPPPDTGIQVLHIDDDVLVVIKPAGLLSVPGRGPDKQDCLETRAQLRWPDARTVHRLDMETSGIILLARNRDAHRHLSMQFEARQITKSYVARVSGVMPESSGTIDLPLMADWPNRPRQIIDHEQGKPSLTHWQVIAREGRATRVRLRPLTGRTHQLRVHMMAIGHAILGDTLYASGAALNCVSRLQLHAGTIGFTHPLTGICLEYEAVCPF